MFPESERAKNSKILQNSGVTGRNTGGPLHAFTYIVDYPHFYYGAPNLEPDSEMNKKIWLSKTLFAFKIMQGHVCPRICPKFHFFWLILSSFDVSE